MTIPLQAGPAIISLPETPEMHFPDGVCVYWLPAITDALICPGTIVTVLTICGFSAKGFNTVRGLNSTHFKK